MMRERRERERKLRWVDLICDMNLRGPFIATSWEDNHSSKVAYIIIYDSSFFIYIYIYIYIYNHWSLYIKNIVSGNF